MMRIKIQNGSEMFSEIRSEFAEYHNIIQVYYVPSCSFEAKSKTK